MKRYISLFENFNDDVQYMVKPVGDSFRIFAKTPKMKADGSEYEDCESLFGKGTMWKDYDSHSSAKTAIDSMSNMSHSMSKSSGGKPHGPNEYFAD